MGEILPAFRHVSRHGGRLTIASESVEEGADESVVAGPRRPELLRLQGKGERRTEVSFPNVRAGELNIGRGERTVQFDDVVQRRAKTHPALGVLRSSRR